MRVSTSRTRVSNVFQEKHAARTTDLFLIFLGSDGPSSPPSLVQFARDMSARRLMKRRDDIL